MDAFSITLTIAYEAVNDLVEPLVSLSLQHSSGSFNETALMFISRSTIRRQVTEFRGTVGGELNNSTLSVVQITGKVDPEASDRVEWTVFSSESELIDDYLVLLPAIVIPAGWLTAAQDPEELKNGLEVSGDGSFTATMQLAFTTGRRTVIELSTTGSSPQSPGRFNYTARISGNLEPGFDVFFDPQISNISSPIFE